MVKNKVVASFVFILIFASVVVSAASFNIEKGVDRALIPVTECGFLDKPGNYVLIKNIESDGVSGGCIFIMSDGVVLDGNGKTVASHFGDRAAIYSQGDDVTIRNIRVVSQYLSRGIYLKNVRNNIIENVNVETGLYGIYLENSVGSRVLDSRVSSWEYYYDFWGFVIDGGRENELIGNSAVDGKTIWYWAVGFYLEDTEDNILIDNEARGLDPSTTPSAFAVGIYMADSYGNEIRNFISRENKGSTAGFSMGTLMERGGDNKFYDFYSNDQVGIDLDGENNFVKNARLENNQIGIGAYNTFDSRLEDIEISNPTFEAVTVASLSSNITFKNLEIENSTSGSKELAFGVFAPKGIKFIDSQVRSYGITEPSEGFVYEDSEFGKIEFLEAISGSGESLADEVRIEENLAVIDASVNPGLDKKAEVTLRNFVLPYEPDPDSIKVLRNGEECRGCSIIDVDLSGMVVVFEVPGEGRYTVA